MCVDKRHGHNIARIRLVHGWQVVGEVHHHQQAELGEVSLREDQSGEGSEGKSTATV